MGHIRETILSEKWNEVDWEVTKEEEWIMRRLNLNQGMIAPQLWKERKIRYNDNMNFSWPTSRFIKLNFDGASKGNPGPAGMGDLFRDDQGRMKWIYANNDGFMRNNKAELMAVRQGLQIAIRNSYNNLEVEGDSQLVVQILKKLNNGASWDKVSKSWRTANLIQDLEIILKRFEYITIKHVRREANKITDFLENWGS